MTANYVQAFLSQQLAAGGSSRRRSVPPSLSEEVSQSLNQRWRERPRCPASPVAPGWRVGVVHAIVGRAACRCLCAQVVHDERATRVLVFVSRSAAMKRPMKSHRNRRARNPTLPGRNALLRIQISLSHHRAFQSRAVLAVVNALRFASTRPAAGPSGIDDACARHDLGYCAMRRLSDWLGRGEKSELTRNFGRRILMYRVCASTAHPPHRTQCMRSAFPAVALRARFKRTPRTSRSAAALSRCA